MFVVLGEDFTMKLKQGLEDVEEEEELDYIDGTGHMVCAIFY